MRRGRFSIAVLSYAILVTCFIIDNPVMARQHESPAANLFGFVRSSDTGEPVVGAQIVLDERRGTLSNRDGYFSFLSVSGGRHGIIVTSIGYAPVDTIIVVSTESAPVELLMTSRPIGLEGIKVEVPRRNPDEPRVSTGRVTPREIRRVPAALEADLFRSLQTLPGIIAPGILSSRLLVRGGASDQNLFLLDGYPVINPHHLGGVFSTFLIDAVQDVRYWIGSPPARFGGRLSSVIDVRLREGNREEFEGSASIGFVSASAIVEGPHALGAWMLGARRTYIDNITRIVDEPVPYLFYDLYGKGYVDIRPPDRLSGLIFLGRDRTWKALGPKPDVDVFNWTNWVAGVSWRHLFGGHAVYEQRFSATGYYERLTNSGVRQGADAAARHDISQLTLSGRLDLVAFGGEHQMQAGYQVAWRNESHATEYEFFPFDELNRARRARSSGRLLSAYIEDAFSVGENLRMRIGLRGEKFGDYASIQPRFGANYRLTDAVTLLLGAGTLRQYRHRVQDPDVPLLSAYDLNIWLSANEPGVEPASVTHVVGGFKAELPSDLTVRVEAYNKRFENVLTIGPYKPSFRIVAIDRLRWADGAARGLDVSLQRSGSHRLKGWLGYSITSSTRRVDNTMFPAAPHPRQRFISVLDWRYDDRTRFTARFEAMEGIPYTPALAMVIDRPYDFGARRFTEYCPALTTLYVYGVHHSARTVWSKRLDLGLHYRDDDNEWLMWEISASLLNALFDPVGIFRPAPADPRRGCNEPMQVLRERELILPPIPSISLRIQF